MRQRQRQAADQFLVCFLVFLPGDQGGTIKDGWAVSTNREKRCKEEDTVSIETMLRENIMVGLWN